MANLDHGGPDGMVWYDGLLFTEMSYNILGGMLAPWLSVE